MSEPGRALIRMFQELDRFDDAMGPWRLDLLPNQKGQKMSESRQDFIQRHRLRKGRQKMSESKHTPVDMRQLVECWFVDLEGVIGDVPTGLAVKHRLISVRNSIKSVAALITSALETAADRDRLLAENAELRGLLSDYGRHDQNCEIAFQNNPKPFTRCSCGYDDKVLPFFDTQPTADNESEAE